MLGEYLKLQGEDGGQTSLPDEKMQGEGLALVTSLQLWIREPQRKRGGNLGKGGEKQGRVCRQGLFPRAELSMRVAKSRKLCPQAGAFEPGVNGTGDEGHPIKEGSGAIGIRRATGGGECLWQGLSGRRGNQEEEETVTPSRTKV